MLVEKLPNASRRLHVSTPGLWPTVPGSGPCLLGLILVLLSACSSKPPKAPSIGEAYVGPAELKLRKDIPLESGVAAIVHAGDRLQIIQQRRGIFLRVRAPNGAEGWTEARQLLSSSDMSGLRELGERAAKLAPQGLAMTYADLGVHTQPSASSPAFLVIKANGKFEVRGHVMAPRVSGPRPPLIPPPPKKQKPAAKPKGANAKLPPLPMPKPPAPPPNWLDLSRSASETDAPAPPPEPPPPPVVMDDWSLIKTAGGQFGWVLTRRLSMAIPDDVAQYAEGHRIVSYFSLGAIADGDQKKDQWLWTTIAGSGQPYDFDSFRVFVWSLRRHRYETAYIERNLKGYGPVEVRDVDVPTGARVQGQQVTETHPGFSLCVEKNDGRRYRRNFAFMGNVVRFAGEQACDAPQPLTVVDAAPAAKSQAVAPAPAPKPGFRDRIRNTWAALKKKWFGR